MEFSRKRRAAAWFVHAYTAMGLPLALLSALALFRGQVELFWALNGTAVLVDATDGALARKVKVKEVLPAFDGRRLDDIVDFITFTFLPCLALVMLNMFPEGLEWAVAAPLLASGYGFCQERAKTDESFVGFPSYWNLGVLYLFLLQTDPWVNLVTISFFAVLVFVPLHYVYPTRTRLMRPVTVFGGYAWAVTLMVLCLNPTAEWARTVTLISLVYPVYYFVLSGVNHVRITRELEA
jgi:phosphatidylcholine synthase